MAPLTSSDPRLPLWGWLVLIGALLAVFAVVLDPGEEPNPEPFGSGEEEIASISEVGEIDRPFADPGEIPAQPWVTDVLTVELRSLGGIESERIAPKRAGSMEGAILNEKKEGIEGVRMTIVGGPQDGWSTVSRSEGHYLFPELLPGTHFVRLEVPGYGTTVRSHRVRGNGRSWRDFRVAPAVGVELALRNHENDPLVGARISYGLDDGEVLSDDDGIVRIPPMVGGERVLLTVRAEGHVPVRQELNLLLRPANAPPIEVPALPKGSRVLGKVSSWPGGSFPEISVVPRSNAIGAHKVAWETWQGIRVEPDGSFVLENLPSSHLVDIRAFHPSGVTEPRLRSVRPMTHTPTRVQFVIKRGQGRVAGKVTDPQGRPLPQATLVLEASDPAAMLGVLYPGLDEVPSTAMLPVPAALRRELRARSDGGFDFAVGDHPDGTGALVLTASAPGYQDRRMPIRRSYTDLHIKLSSEDRLASLRIDPGTRPRLPRIEWYLDGRPVDDMGGLQVQRAGKVETLIGLSTGLYDVLVRAGTEVLRHDREYRLAGSAEIVL
ncbi:MAG: carboxypeptidase-like regulatory domain-containing protein [Planctomycetes bacterium]|nr:carboxypeptidase-like regulatory domain-containing protein [Planctomycetota bacterium]